MPPKLKSKTDRTARTKTDRTARTKTVRSCLPTANQIEAAHDNLLQALCDAHNTQYDTIEINDCDFPDEDLTLSDLLGLASGFEFWADDAANMYRSIADELRLAAADAQRICNALPKKNDQS